MVAIFPQQSQYFSPEVTIGGLDSEHLLIFEALVTIRLSVFLPSSQRRPHQTLCVPLARSIGLTGCSFTASFSGIRA